MNENALEEFLWWMCERQRIYKRKEIDGEEPPWTDDEVLRTGHFCHVFRELDRGTRYVFDEIIGAGDPEDVYFNLLLYRLINLPSTFDAIGGFTPIDEFDGDQIVETVLERQERDETVFSSAYRIPGPKAYEYDTRIKRIVYAGIQDYLEDWDVHWTDFRDAAEPEDVIEIMIRMPGMGDFIAYEVYTDLTYTGWFPFGQNDYVNIGPGAEGGLVEIFDSKEERHLHWLGENQGFLFDKYDLDFYSWNGQDEKRLTLRDIEHSLCEYRKYCEWRERGYPSRKYRHETQQNLDDFH